MVALLLGVGGFKVFGALGRGHSNVLFLIFLMLVAPIFAWGVCCPRQTERGKFMLEDLRALYGGLKARAAAIPPGGATIEALMLAAVFGLGLLPATNFGYAKTLFPQATGTSSSGCGSGCGSSCGGGGCGGGCGGCGS